MKPFLCDCHNKTPLIMSTLIALVLITSLATPLSADPVTWYLNGTLGNLTLNEGTITGSFAYDPLAAKFLGGIVLFDVNITVTPSGYGLPPFTFTDADYEHLAFPGEPTSDYMNLYFVSLTEDNSPSKTLILYVDNPMDPPGPLSVHPKAIYYEYGKQNTLLSTCIYYKPYLHIYDIAASSTISTTPVPEPSTMLLLGSGLLGLAGLRRKFRK